MQPAAVVTAQMCGALPSAPSHPSPTSSPTSLLDGGLCPSPLRPRAHGREGCSDGQPGQDCGQAESTGIGPDSHHEGDPTVSKKVWPCYGHHVQGCPQSNQHGQWVHCAMCDLRIMYTPRIGSSAQHTTCNKPGMIARVLRELEPMMGNYRPTAAIVRAMQANRGVPPEPDPAPPGERAGYDACSEDHCSTYESRGSFNGKLAGDIGHGGHGPRGGLRARGPRAALNEQQYDAKEMLKPLTQRLCGRVMSFAALMATSLMGLHLEDRDGLWEIACAPHSWLSEAAF